MSKLTAAFRRLWYELRCLWAETVFGWAMKIAPAGYVPSWVQSVVDAHYGALKDVAETSLIFGSLPSRASEIPAASVQTRARSR